MPGLAPQKIGILLVEEDSLYTRFRPHWWYGSVVEDEAEIWGGFSEDLAQRAREIGAAALLDLLEDTASHAIRISLRKQIRFAQAEITLNTLYRQYVEDFATALEPTEPKPAWPRLPQFSGWFTRPAILKAGMSAACAAALLLTIQFHGHKSPVAHVNLSPYRDAEPEVVPEKLPVHITVGPVALPDGAVDAEVLNDVGSEVWRGNTSISRQYAEISLPSIQGSGIHLLRLYSLSPHSNQMLTEVRFLVKNENGTPN